MPVQNVRRDKKMKGDSKICGALTAGFNSSMKLLRNGQAQKVFLAYDSSEQFREKIRAAAKEAGVDLDESNSMAQLGILCGLDVGCAVCTVRKQ